MSVHALSFAACALFTTPVTSWQAFARIGSDFPAFTPSVLAQKATFRAWSHADVEDLLPLSSFGCCSLDCSAFFPFFPFLPLFAGLLAASAVVRTAVIFAFAASRLARGSFNILEASLYCDHAPR